MNHDDGHILMGPARISDDDAAYLGRIIREVRPRLVLETGTYYGQGSTLVIAEALGEIGAGLCMTWERHRPFHEAASAYYARRSDLAPYVVCICSDMVTGLAGLNGQAWEAADIVFLDGGDEMPDGERPPGWKLASESLAAFRIVENMARCGTHVLLHDWTFPEGRGALVKQVLNPVVWRVVAVTPSHEGLAHLTKRAVVT